MLGHVKALHTNTKKCIQITIQIPGCEEIFYSIPNTEKERDRVDKFFQALPEKRVVEDVLNDEAIPWEEAAKERIAKYTKSGLVLRGVRCREGLSQKELASQCHISQENISKMENGKRTIGKDTAKKLAKVLNTDYRVFLSRKTA
jgi:plasmid maintenance system antidote protein VapI